MFVNKFLDQKFHDVAKFLIWNFASQKTLSISGDSEAIFQVLVIPLAFPVRIVKIQVHILKETKEYYSISNLKCILRMYWIIYIKRVHAPAEVPRQSSSASKISILKRVSANVLNGETLINVDERSFDCGIRIRYSWVPKGKDNSIINDRIWGKANLILATWSMWDWFGVTLVWTQLTPKSIVYMNLLELIMKNHFSDDKEMLTELKLFALDVDFRHQKQTILIDNARMHT